jgi:hypothetical protein
LQSKGVLLLLDNIKITKASAGLEVSLPRTKKIQISGENESVQTTMASGKKVSDIIGHRITITAEYDYLPANIMTALMAVVRAGGYCLVEYPDISGDASGMFEISVPSPGIFKFRDNIPIWHGAILNFTAQEVI